MNLATFRVRYSQFSTVGDVLVQLFLDEALLFIGEAWEAFADLGQGLYAAHYCALDAAEKATTLGASQAGDVVSKGVGSLNISRSAQMLQSQMEDSMMRTTFGQRFVELANRAGAGALVAGGGTLDDRGTGVAGIDTVVLPFEFSGGGELL